METIGRAQKERQSAKDGGKGTEVSANQSSPFTGYEWNKVDSVSKFCSVGFEFLKSALNPKP